MNDEKETDVFSKAAQEHATQRLEAEKIIKKIVLVVLGAISTSFIIYAFKDQFSDQTVCEFVSRRWLTYLWPPNGWVENSLNLTAYSYRQKCEFIAMRSIMSAIMVAFIILLLCSRFFKPVNYHIGGSILPFILIFGFGAYASFDPMSDTYSKFKMSISSSVEVNLIKSGVYIYGVYLCVSVMLCKISFRKN
ncbi:hypothetical protein SAMN05216328_13549 [Ensifer sp. YR511]|nr:hypothetical protein SAMN05216328_13549 [Ensifer sp. YR511]